MCFCKGRQSTGAAEGFCNIESDMGLALSIWRKKNAIVMINSIHTSSADRRQLQDPSSQVRRNSSSLQPPEASAGWGERPGSILALDVGNSDVMMGSLLLSRYCSSWQALSLDSFLFPFSFCPVSSSLSTSSSWSFFMSLQDETILPT